MRKTLLSLATATAIAVGTTTVAPTATAAEPTQLEQLSSNAGPFGLLAVLGGSVLGIYALLSLAGKAVK